MDRVPGDKVCKRIITSRSELKLKLQQYSQVVEFVKGAISEEKTVPYQDIFTLRKVFWKHKFEKARAAFNFVSVKYLHHLNDMEDTNIFFCTIGTPVADLIPWLQSVGEEGGPFRIALDIPRYLCAACPYGRCVIAYGHPSLHPMTRLPELKVLFFREIPVDRVEKYRQVLLRRNELCRGQKELSEIGRQ